MIIKLISWISCSRCRFIEPHLKERSEKNWYEFIEKDVNEASPEEIEWATQLPVIWFDNEQKDYDEVVNILSNW